MVEHMHLAGAPTRTMERPFGQLIKAGAVRAYLRLITM